MLIYSVLEGDLVIRGRDMNAESGAPHLSGSDVDHIRQHNLAMFNVTTTQACLLTTKRNPLNLPSTFENVSDPLVIDISSNFNFRFERQTQQLHYSMIKTKA